MLPKIEEIFKVSTLNIIKCCLYFRGKIFFVQNFLLKDKFVKVY